MPVIFYNSQAAHIDTIYSFLHKNTLEAMYHQSDIIRCRSWQVEKVLSVLHITIEYHIFPLDHVQNHTAP